MKPADILRMIEEVSPDDTGKLDEIDARVFEWLPWQTLPPRPPKYTRSRDALKTIRPNWCAYSMNFYGAFTEISFWKCELASAKKTFASVGCQTEELAELHAIIQAIAYERGGE